MDIIYEIYIETDGWDVEEASTLEEAKKIAEEMSCGNNDTIVIDRVERTYGVARFVNGKEVKE